MARRWQWIMLTMFLAACASTGSPSNQPDGVGMGDDSSLNDPTPPTERSMDAPQPIRADLEDLGPAPELGNEVWLNADQPLRLANLRGSVILLDMWTFG